MENGLMDQKQAKQYLRSIASDTQFSMCQQHFCSYLEGVYNLWHQDNPLKRLKTKTKGRTEIVNSVREFQRGKLEFIPMLKGIYHGFNTTHKNYIESLGGSGADKDLSNAIRQLAKLYKQAVWNDFCAWAKSNSETIWDTKYSKRMETYLKEAAKTQNVEWIAFLFPKALNFWAPGRSGKFGINTDTTPASLDDDYNEWNNSLETNLKKDNESRNNVSGIRQNSSSYKDDKQATTKIQPEEQKIEEQLDEENDEEHDVDWKNETENDDDLITQNNEEIPTFLQGNHPNLGFKENISKIANSLRSTVRKSNTGLKGELDTRLKKAGFWN